MNLIDHIIDVALAHEALVGRKLRVCHCLGPTWTTVLKEVNAATDTIMFEYRDITFSISPVQFNYASGFTLT